MNQNTTAKFFEEISMDNNIFVNDTAQALSLKNLMEKNNEVICPLCKETCKESFFSHIEKGHKKISPLNPLKRLLAKKKEVADNLQDIFLLRYLFQLSVRNPNAWSKEIKMFNSLKNEFENLFDLALFDYYEFVQSK